MEKWFQNRKVSWRLGIICVFLALPIGVLLYFYARGVWVGWRSAELEHIGNQYQRPFQKLMRHLPEHYRLVRRYLEKHEPVQAEIEAKGAEIVEDINELQLKEDQYRKQLALTDDQETASHNHLDLKDFRGDWQQLSAVVLTQPLEASRPLYKHMFGDVMAMIDYVATQSGLTQDPELHSYYLMDITMRVMPQSLKVVYHALNDAQEAIDKPPLTEDQRIEFAASAALLDNIKSRIINAATGGSETVA
ncbi:MAG: hypothetical protein ACYCW6_30020, partial [Candidatus Xenobia bacterium]